MMRPAERALAEALAAARALGRLWRRKASRALRLEALAQMGVLETPRSVVDALIKTTLAGGFRLVRTEDGRRRPEWGEPDEPEDHEPFLLTRQLPPPVLDPERFKSAWGAVYDRRRARRRAWAQAVRSVRPLTPTAAASRSSGVRIASSRAQPTCSSHPRWQRAAAAHRAASARARA